MKKILFILLAVCTLVGCHSKKDEYFYIDLVFPMTGNGAAASETTINAIQLCIDKWNNHGGINNQVIVIRKHDSKGMPKEGVMIAKKIAMEKSDLVVSAMSPVSLSMLPFLENNEIIHLAFSGAKTLFESNPKHVIRGSISPNQIGYNLINAFKNNYPEKELVVFYCQDEFGQGYLDATLNAARKMDIKHIRTIGYENNVTSYRDIITKSNISNDDVLFVIGLQGSLGKMIKQLRESGYNGTILCEPNITSASTLAMLTSESLSNLYYLSPIENDSLTGTVVTNYQNLFGSTPSELALDAYNNVDIVLTYIQKSEQKMSYDKIWNNNITIEGLFGTTSIHDFEIQYNLQLESGENL